MRDMGESMVSGYQLDKIAHNCNLIDMNRDDLCSILLTLALRFDSVPTCRATISESWRISATG
jgi:hypothetical protein